MSARYKSIIVGDFNVDMLNARPTQSETSFCDMFLSLNFNPKLNLPTRVTSTSESLIDHCWVNWTDSMNSGTFDLDVSDHFPIFIIIPLMKSNIQDKYRISFRVHSEEYFDRFRTRIVEMSPYFCNNSFVNVSEVCRDFLNMLSSIYNDCFPLKQKWVSRKRILSPWLTDGLLRSIRHKHNLFKSSRINPSLIPIYKRYRNSLIFIIKKAKKQFYDDKFETARGNNTKTWKIINSVLQPNKPMKNKVIELDTPHGHPSSCPATVADLFNRHFVSVGGVLDGDIPASNNDPCMYVNNNENSFMCHPTTPNEIISLAHSCKLKNSKIDEIPVNIILRSMDLLAPCISNIINVSFLEGIFPDCLKSARVIPLHKKGSTSDPSNYRPISTLPFLSKLFEKAMYNRMVKFLNKFNIISPNQFGFRQNSSANDAILTFTTQIHGAINDGRYCAGIFLDFSKAFDTVNHGIMLGKLERLGFRGVSLRWLQTFLVERQQYVSVSGSNSAMKRIPMGTPQGSTLSPLLFSIYINDMCRSSSLLNFTHFADDTTISLSSRNLRELEETLNEELSRLDNWLCSNRLSLNIGKTHYMLFSCGKPDFDLNLKIRNVAIDKPEEESVKLLGVMIDNRLNFNHHINLLSSKLRRACGIIFRMSSFLPQRILKMLYNSIFLPHLVYCIEIWGNTNVANIRRVTSLQNRAVKLLGMGDLINIYKSNNILPLKSLHKYFTLLKFFQQHVLKRSKDLNNEINTLQPTHDYPTRFAEDLCLNIPRVNKSKFYLSFIYRGITYWNELPSSFHQFYSFSSFKINLRRHLINEFTSVK